MTGPPGPVRLLQGRGDLTEALDRLSGSEDELCSAGEGGHHLTGEQVETRQVVGGAGK